MSAVRRDLPAVARAAGHAPSTVHVRLTWRSGRPHEVRMDIGRTPWVIGWQLLRAGVHGPAGVGDVFVSPHPDGLRHEIVVDNGRGRAALQIDSLDLQAFVDDVADVWADRTATDDDYASLLGGAT